MDTIKLHNALDKLKELSNDGALSCDVYAMGDGQSIMGFNSNPVASAMFNNVTKRLLASLREGGMPSLGKFYLIELEEGKAFAVLNMGKYQWNILLDTQLCSFGLLINIVIPKVAEIFKDSLDHDD
ncbi:MAG: hypothetical protein LBV07_02770 [Syntrophobacterales bacterium]|jgi:hypothetical protein|nr:hypothetical protein [Syntrophobacterales bacterium]